MRKQTEPREGQTVRPAKVFRRRGDYGVVRYDGRLFDVVRVTRGSRRVWVYTGDYEIEHTN